MKTDRLNFEVLNAIKDLNESGDGANFSTIGTNEIVARLNLGQDHAPTRSEVDEALSSLEGEGLIEKSNTKCELTPQGEKVRKDSAPR